ARSTRAYGTQTSRTMSGSRVRLVAPSAVIGSFIFPGFLPPLRNATDTSIRSVQVLLAVNGCAKAVAFPRRFEVARAAIPLRSVPAAGPRATTFATPGAAQSGSLKHRATWNVQLPRRV